MENNKLDKTSNFIEKKCFKYVIATLDNPTMYLRYLLDGKYVFVDDIERATKTLKYKLANDLKKYYYNDTKDNTDLVIIPVRITYELINETN